MNRSHEQVEARVDWLLHLEFSLNLSDYKSKFLAHYKAEREEHEKSDLVTLINNYNSATDNAQPPANQCQPALPNQPTGIAKVLASLSEIGLSGIKAEDLANLLPPDRMAPALEIMANVRAYFQGWNIYFHSIILSSSLIFSLVAYKRFTDTVPLAIDYEVVRGAEGGILQLLYTSLGINGHDGLRIVRSLSRKIHILRIRGQSCSRNSTDWSMQAMSYSPLGCDVRGCCIS